MMREWGVRTPVSPTHRSEEPTTTVVKARDLDHAVKLAANILVRGEVVYRDIPEWRSVDISD